MPRKIKGNCNRKNTKQLLSILFFIICFICILINNQNNISSDNVDFNENITYFNIADIPEYTEDIYVTVNNNIPYFDTKDMNSESFEIYSELDSLGRCGTAYANICKEIMPAHNEERESISNIYPTGWKQKKYNGEYLYNRCHLIGYQLAGENANELNLITGTRYFNVSGMLIFENKVAEYLEVNENNHVLYRITPIFVGNNLLVSGVQMEAYSVEDKGKGICFNVYIYNVQPGINIDYVTGKSYKE